jgi:hypothetical protein
MAFYCACGFLQINLQETTGIELLPKTIAETLYNKNAEGFAWIVPELEEHCIIPLMQLCFGSLLNTPKEVHVEKDHGGSSSLLNSAKEVVDIQNDQDDASNGGSSSNVNGGSSSNVFLWCQHPPSISYVDNAPVSALLTNMDMKEAYAGLDLLNNLLPLPLGLLVSPEKM